MCKKGTVCLLIYLLLIFYQNCYAGVLVDPTRPPAGYQVDTGKGVKPQDLSLSAIFAAANQKKVAVINGQFVQEGSSILSYQVIRITEQKVEIQGPTGNFTLSLVPMDVKTPVDNKADSK